MKCKLVNENFKNDYTNKLLISRGVSSNDLEKFYNPTSELLESPELLTNIGQGVNLLVKHLPQSNIAIVVDSDVDGFTSSAIMYQYLMKINPSLNIKYFLHRGKGHGLSDTINDILSEGINFGLVILPDAGSNDDEYHLILKENNIDCLVLDHHLVEPETKFIDNTVIINNQASEKYENKDLSGAGVAWQFCRFMDKVFENDYANDFIDLAALGIVSDMMSVLELENRYIIQEGFSNIKNYFFQCLCNKQEYSMGGKVTPMTVAFYITPLINAMIRVGTEDEKQRCFEAFIDGHKLVESHKRGAKGTMEEVAIESARECTNARARQNRILDKAVEELEIKINKYDLLENKILFVRLDVEDFPSELNGLIAMKLAARYQRPTIVARLNDEGEIKGSSRGLNESELTSFKNFMDESGFFTFTAGHDNACGIGIYDKNLSNFHEYANKELAHVDFGENWYEVNFERIAMDKDITDLISNLTDYENIWGQHNNEPMIHVMDINVSSSDIQVMGKNQDTVKIMKNGVAYMFFKCKDKIDEFKKYNQMKIDVVGRANMNEWMGNYTPQIFVSDFEISDGALGF